MKGGISVVVLKSVSRFMSGNPQSGQGRTSVDSFGETKDFFPGIVVIGQPALNLFNIDISGPFEM